MSLSARFETFNLSLDGEEVIYHGVLAGQGRVEIRQSVDDLDVMLVLLAHVLGRRIGADGEPAQGHNTLTGKAEQGPQGVTLSLTADFDVVRRFEMTPEVALQLSTRLAAAARRGRLRVVS